MKCAIFILVLCAPAVLSMFAGSLDDLLHGFEEDCANISGASFSSIEEARQARSIPDNEQMNAFSKCMLQKHNVMNNDGSINSNVSSYKIPRDTDSVFRISERCIILRGRDNGDTARKIMNCYLEGGEIVLALRRRPTKE